MTIQENSEIISVIKIVRNQLNVIINGGFMFKGKVKTLSVLLLMATAGFAQAMDVTMTDQDDEMDVEAARRAQYGLQHAQQEVTNFRQNIHVLVNGNFEFTVFMNQAIALLQKHKYNNTHLNDGVESQNLIASYNKSLKCLDLLREAMRKRYIAAIDSLLREVTPLQFPYRLDAITKCSAQIKYQLLVSMFQQINALDEKVFHFYNANHEQYVNYKFTCQNTLNQILQAIS